MGILGRNIKGAHRKCLYIQIKEIFIKHNPDIMLLMETRANSKRAPAIVTKLNMPFNLKFHLKNFQGVFVVSITYVSLESYNETNVIDVLIVKLRILNKEKTFISRLPQATYESVCGKKPLIYISLVPFCACLMATEKLLREILGK